MHRARGPLRTRRRASEAANRRLGAAQRAAAQASQRRTGTRCLSNVSNGGGRQGMHHSNVARSSFASCKLRVLSATRRGRAPGQERQALSVDEERRTDAGGDAEGGLQ